MALRGSGGHVPPGGMNNLKGSQVEGNLSVQEPWRSTAMRKAAGKTSVFLVIALLILRSPSAATNAQLEDGLAVTANAGLDGYCREGSWLPLRVQVENQGPAIEALVMAVHADLDGSRTRYGQAVSLPSGSQKALTIYIYPEPFLDELEIQILEGDRLLANSQVKINCLPSTYHLVGVVSGNPTPFSLLTELGTAERNVLIAQIDPQELPGKAAGLDLLDFLIFADIDTGILTRDQREAIATWLTQGGTLVIAGGPTWQKTTAGLSEVLPVLLDGNTSVVDLEPLSQIPGAEWRLAGEAVISTGSPIQGAQILAGGTEAPLVVWNDKGAGQVIFVAADPGLEPLRSWPGAPEFYRQIFSLSGPQPPWNDGFQDWYAASRSASTIPGIVIPSIALICSFLMIYVLVIGPLHFLLLRKFKRREIAWISLPILVVIFSGISLWLGTQTRGRWPVVNRLALIQAWEGSQPARVDALLGTFSPRRATYQLEVGGDALIHPVQSDMFGTTGSNWILLQGPQSTTLPQLRIDVGGVSTMAVRGVTRAPDIDSSLTISHESRGTFLTGNITYLGPKTLKDAVLLAPGTATPLGDLTPGSNKPVNLSLERAQHGGSGIPSPNYYPGSGFVMEEILGAPYYTTFDDPILRRRGELLNALLSPNQIGGRGGGVYLAAWLDESPVPVSLGEVKFITVDTTLILVSLELSLQETSNTMLIPPGLFVWEVTDSSFPGLAAPYDVAFDRGGYSLRFVPASPVLFDRVESLTLHLESHYSQGPAPMSVSLWDYMEDSWSTLMGVAWGDVEIPTPERYVGPGGEIRLHIEHGGDLDVIQISRTDFSLVVVH